MTINKVTLFSVQILFPETVLPESFGMLNSQRIFWKAKPKWGCYRNMYDPMCQVRVAEEV